MSYRHVLHYDICFRGLPARELKKGSAELLILALVEDRPRHGYDIGKLIEARSKGALRFNVASLYPLLYRLEKRGWMTDVDGEGGPAAPAHVQTDRRGPKGARGAARRVEGLRARGESDRRRRD